MHLTRLLPAALLVAVTMSGCLGGEARTEWAFEVTQLSQVGATGRDGYGVIVALLDTGINPKHVALTHLFDGVVDNGEVTAFQDFVGGRSGVANAYDDDGHGSHVAGIIAASGSTLGDKLVYGGVNLQGGAPAVKLVIAKVCPANSPCKAESIPAAVRWATAQHAQVISLSLGGDRDGSLFSAGQRDELTRSVQQAVAAGVVVIASAGNEGTATGDVATPADIMEVIAVGAIQQDGTVWSNSSRGNDAGNPCQVIPILGVKNGRCDPNKKPEIVAPGVEILSAWTGDSYVRATGTSQATPFVTAAVALMLEGRAPLTTKAEVEQVKQVLVDTAQPIPGQARPHDVAAGYGLLQAADAIAAYRGV